VLPEETAATATVDSGKANAANAGVEQDAVRFHYYAPHAPPALRFEVRGRAPSERHFWAPGYWRWNGREHVWMGGRWELRRDGYEYMGPRWFHRAGRWEYLPGHWVRRVFA
jgi:WXXGXW repeat (2 copies)